MIDPNWLKKCKEYLSHVATDIEGNRIVFVHVHDLQQLIYHVENYKKLLCEIKRHHLLEDDK